MMNTKLKSSGKTRRRAVDELIAVLDSKFFKALSEPARVDIIKFLMLNGCCDIGTISDQLPQDRSVISRHLNQMLDAGLLKSYKEGRFRMYEINSKGFLERVMTISEQIKRCIAECCPPG